MYASKAYWGYSDDFMNKFMELFQLTENYLANNTVKVMMKGDKIVGICGFKLHENNTLELDYFFIHPDYIGKGLGKKLWDFTCEVAQQLTDHSFILWSDPEAETFYIKMGCRRIGMKKSPLLPNREAPMMQYFFDPLSNNTRKNFKDIKLIAASLDDYSTIQNMARFYVYDMSEYLGNDKGWECPETGLYECIDFKKYWETADTFPFLIRYQNELAGFVIIDKKGSESTVDFNVAQFFILRKFKKKGIGKYVAHQCFDQFRGRWEVMVIPGNEGAYQFWRSVIKEYTGNQFNEYTKCVVHLENSLKDIFCFKSRVDQK